MAKQNLTWTDFAKAVLAIAKNVNQYGADAQFAEERTRAVKGRCSPHRAIAELRRIYTEENRLATPVEIVSAAMGPIKPDRWITLSREIIGKGRYTFARQVPNDGSPAGSYLKPGEALVADTAAKSGVRVHWSECEEGRKFRALIEKLSKCPAHREGFASVGKVYAKEEK